MLDLHIHSAYSDGSETPAEIVRLAKRSSLRAIALTDHDNLDGVLEFFDACHEEGMTGISGIELSVEPGYGSTLHILGLGIDPRDKNLQKGLLPVLESRQERNQRILEKLCDLGFGLTWEEVEELAGKNVVGRPHFALAMVARGWAQTSAEAFENYLEKGAPAYVDRFRLNPGEAIRLIADAGGLAVIAHPTSWHDDFGVLRTEIAKLKDLGLRGIEAYHPGIDPEENLECLRIAKRLDLLVSGGSDFHGKAAKPGVKIGIGDGSLYVPDKLLQPVLSEISQNGRVMGDA